MKVNLGCGSEILEGYTNVDVRQFPGVIVCDLKDLSRFEDNSWDHARLSHVIEHFTWDEAVLIVEQIRRKLKTGGTIEIYCPDAYMLTCHYQVKVISIHEFSRLLFGNQRYPEELHKMALDRNRLTDLLQATGFKVIGYEPRPNAYPYDLGIQGTKVERP